MVLHGLGWSWCLTASFLARYFMNIGSLARQNGTRNVPSVQIITTAHTSHKLFSYMMRECLHLHTCPPYIVTTNSHPQSRSMQMKTAHIPRCQASFNHHPPLFLYGFIFFSLLYFCTEHHNTHTLCAPHVALSEYAYST